MTKMLLSTQTKLESRRLITLLGCWLWTGGYNAAGYGLIAVSGRMLRVHRVAYEFYVGPIPESLELDHLCRNKGCFNPGHLEPVTHKENVRRYHQQGTKPQVRPLLDTVNRN